VKDEEKNEMDFLKQETKATMKTKKLDKEKKAID
jgi:hypothetical protein